MNRPSRWIIGGATVAAALLILFVSLVVLAPRLISAERVRSRLLIEVQQKIGYNLEFDALEVFLFPKPHLLIHQARVLAPERIEGAMHTVAVFPKLLPLFAGKIQLSRVDIDAPNFTVVLPELKPPGQAPGAFSPEQVWGKATPWLDRLISKAPGLELSIHQGRVELVSGLGEDPTFLFENLETTLELPHDRLEIELACTSNLWKKLSLQGFLDPKATRSEGRMAVAQLSPQPLLAYLFAEAPYQVNDAQADLELDLVSESRSHAQINLKGSIPLLDVTHQEKARGIRQGTLDAQLHLKDDRVDFKLTNLSFDYPRISMEGQFLVDPAVPSASAQLKGRDADAAAVREVLTGLFEENPVVRRVFEIVRAGHVPLVTFEAQGSSVAQIRKLENMVIQGNLSRGTIVVPKVELEVEDASGEMRIAQTILECTNLVGRSKASQGKDGTLRLGLRGGDAPLHFEMDIDADIAEVPPILNRIVKNDIFLRELALIQDIQGRAAGRLILGESTKAIRTRVDVQSFRLASRYERIPYPVEIESGGFFYEGKTVALRSISGKLGRSSFEGLSSSLDWEKNFLLEATVAAPGSISLDEIQAWMVSYEGLKRVLKPFQSVQGIFLLDSLRFNGPLRAPRQWQFQVKGRAKGVTAKTAWFPEPVTIRSGAINVDHENFFFDNCVTQGMDALLTVSGRFIGYAEGLRGADFTFKGTGGASINQWVSNLIHLPSDLKVRAPLSISQSRLIWEKEGKTSFAADLTVEGGTRVSLNVMKRAQELSLNQLLLKDEYSNAALSLKLKQRELDLNFKGTLNKKSVDRVLLNNRYFMGMARGDFNAVILMDQPMKSTAHGELESSGFRYPWRQSMVELQSVSLEASGHQAQVKSALLNWVGHQVTMTGSVDVSPEAYLVNLDLYTERLDWTTLKPAYDQGTTAQPSDPTRKPWNVPVQGTVKVRTDRFATDRFTFMPFEANLLLQPQGVQVDVLEAGLCGISTAGRIQFPEERVRLNLKSEATNKDLDTSLQCLWNKEKVLTGTFSFNAELSAQGGTLEALTQSLQGKAEWTAQKGRVFRFEALRKIFALINITEIYRGQLPDLVNQGCAYDSMTMKGDIQIGKLTIKEGLMDGPCVKLVWYGDVDLVSKTLDLTVLVSPLRTVDRIVGNIPVLGHILGGALITIPVGVSGDMDDPNVVPLSPSAIGSEILGYMKRTLQLPFKLFQPLF